MPLYAAPSARTARQIAADLSMLLWVIGWILIGRAVWSTINSVADPARKIADSTQSLGKNFGDAAESSSHTPGIGKVLRKPFDAAAGSVADMSGSAHDLVISIERLAIVSGILAALIPISVMLAIWLPARIRFAVEARAAQRFIDAAPDMDLFALRAMANQPMTVLAKISPDPVGAWRADDRRIIEALAATELRRSGLKPPAAQRSP